MLSTLGGLMPSRWSVMIFTPRHVRLSVSYCHDSRSASKKSRYCASTNLWARPCSQKGFSAALWCEPVGTDRPTDRPVRCQQTPATVLLLLLLLYCTHRQIERQKLVSWHSSSNVCDMEMSRLWSNHLASFHTTHRFLIAIIQMGPLS